MVNVPFMPEEAKTITVDCFHLNSSISHTSPLKGLPIGWGPGRQLWKTLSRGSLRGFLESMIHHPVFCFVLNILMTKGETVACSSTQSMPERPAQSSMKGQDQTKPII